MHVLGTLNHPNPPTSFDPGHLLLFTLPGYTMPKVYCPPTRGTNVQIILFDRPSPHRMQYMSLRPISLVLGDKSLITPTPDSGHEIIDLSENKESSAKAHLVEKLELHTVIYQSPSLKEKLLPTILAQINCSSELADLISKNVYVLKVREKRNLSVGAKVVVSAATLRDYVFDLAWQISVIWIWPVITRAFIVALICHRLAAEAILFLLGWRPRVNSAALTDVSATAQQVDIRLQQFCYWPIQYLTLRKRKEDWESMTDRHPDYIRFYNSLWLVANDVIIGIALGSYIIENAAWVAWQINTILNGWTIEGLMDMISWLMDWPAGLKLNNELAVFLGRLVLFMIDYWRSTGPQVSLGFTY